MSLSSNTARFPRMQGAVTIVPGAPERAMVYVTFDATAIEAPDSVTLARLRGDKFFWVEKYPTIRFVGRSLQMASPTRGTVAGELTARGQTRPATLAVTFDSDPVAAASMLLLSRMMLLTRVLLSSAILAASAAACCCVP